jgi:hypothetical protein
MNKQEILRVIDSPSNFNTFIESADTLNGQALGLIIDVAGVDGDDWADQECLEIIKEIIDLTIAYRNTQDKVL